MKVTFMKRKHFYKTLVNVKSYHNVFLMLKDSSLETQI